MTEEGRRASAERQTRETTISTELNLDGTGRSQIDTGVGFLNHMLELLAKHALFDVTIQARGDLDVDPHHTTEDVGIVLGDVLCQALGDKAGVTRFADARCPMQESLASVALDVSGRPYLSYNVGFPTQKVGEFDVELVAEFLHAFCTHGGLNMHVDVIRGENSHHIAEAIFKALARALRQAVRIDSRAAGQIPSTKGTL